jgi:hypothetical protein
VTAARLIAEADLERRALEIFDASECFS